MYSLRAALMIGTGVTTVILVGAASATLYFLVRSTLFAEFDQLLVAKARALTVFVKQEANEIEVDFVEHPLEEFERADYFQLWHEDGSVLARSRRLKGHVLDRISGEAGEPVFRDISLPDGRPGRVVGISFHPRIEEGANVTRHPLTLVLARETAAIEATLSKLAWILFGVASATTVLILGTLACVINRSLRPVDRLAWEIDSINEDQLAVRLNLEDAPKELLPVVRCLNNLFIRLHAAFEREKSFTAGAAHELRTPLAGLRSTLEVSLSHQRSADSYCESMETCLMICRRMQSIVETLLSIARQGEAAAIGWNERVHLASILRDCWITVAERACERNLHIEWQVEESVQINTDEARFKIIVCNLLENAVAYTDEGGIIRVETLSGNDGATLRITNSGSRIDVEDVKHVFQPFWRGDAARSDADMQTGLGLSLCRKLADSLGCKISASSVNGGDFCVILVFQQSIPLSTNRKHVVPVINR